MRKVQTQLTQFRLIMSNRDERGLASPPGTAMCMMGMKPVPTGLARVHGFSNFYTQSGSFYGLIISHHGHVYALETISFVDRNLVLRKITGTAATVTLPNTFTVPSGPSDLVINYTYHQAGNPPVLGTYISVFDRYAGRNIGRVWKITSDPTVATEVISFSGRPTAMVSWLGRLYLAGGTYSRAHEAVRVTKVYDEAEEATVIEVGDVPGEIIAIFPVSVSGQVTEANSVLYIQKSGGIIVWDGVVRDILTNAVGMPRVRIPTQMWTQTPFGTYHIGTVHPIWRTDYDDVGLALYRSLPQEPIRKMSLDLDALLINFEKKIPIISHDNGNNMTDTQVPTVKPAAVVYSANHIYLVLDINPGGPGKDTFYFLGEVAGDNLIWSGPHIPMMDMGGGFASTAVVEDYVMIGQLRDSNPLNKTTVFKGVDTAGGAPICVVLNRFENEKLHLERTHDLTELCVRGGTIAEAFVISEADSFQSILRYPPAGFNPPDRATNLSGLSRIPGSRTGRNLHLVIKDWGGQNTGRPGIQYITSQILFPDSDEIAA